jgi:Protein of unknown function (DUF3575)
MRKITLLTLIIFCFNTAKSQWGVTFTPAIVYTHSGHFGLQFGGQYRFSEKLDLVTEFTTAINRGKDPSITNEQYFRIKPELRYFVVKRKANTGGYVGLQFSYTSRKWKDINGSYFEDRLFEDSAIAFQSASVRSPVFSSSVQLGSVIPLGDHFRIDLFLGAGVRIIDTKYSDVVSSGKIYSVRPNCQIMFSPDPAWLVNGTITRPHFNTGVRFIYRF